METITVMLCGVGGQGTILAADLLAKTAAAAGVQVKLSEVHGMSQRGGAVDTVVRFGDEVASPVTDLGHVDHLVAFERIEARRQLPFLKQGGTLLVNDAVIDPLSVRMGTFDPPKNLTEDLEAANAVLIDASRIALEAGSPRSANVVLMGALSTYLPFDEGIWRSVIEKRVPPKTIEANLKAFDAGREVVATREA